MSALITLVATILQLLGIVIFKFYGWVVIVLVLLYLIWQNRRREIWVSNVEYTLLKIEVPRENEKKELSAEQMFASLHGILRPDAELAREGSLQEHISLEIAAKGGQIQFYVWTPRHLKDFVEGQIYAQYPTVQITEDAPDYTAAEDNQAVQIGTDLVLTKPDILPIKTFASFEVDPLAGITAVMSKLEQAGEELWVQVLARPVDDSWRDRGLAYIDQVKNGKKTTFTRVIINALLDLPVHILSNLISGIGAAPEAKKEDKKDTKKEMSTGQATVIKGVEEKIAKLGYAIKIRIVYLGPDPELGRQRLMAIVGGFKQFNTVNLNGFAAGGTKNNPEYLEDYRARLFLEKGSVLNLEELASLYHLPHKSVETPNLAWATTKTAEPPANLPTETTATGDSTSLIGMTNFRGRQLKFGIKRSDRGRHLYIIGQTGTGKSGLLQLLMISDLYHNQGMAVVDPHGDLATDIMKFVPAHRVKDVIYFNPADRDFPIAFNPMEVTDPNFKNHISSELVGVLKRLFDSWGPRLEYILRFTILALLDYPDSTMLGITRMLTEKGFRNKVIKEIKDPIVKNFWVTEFASWNDKFASEAVAPVLNKVGAFTANPLIRNIVGQPKSGVNLRRMMDEGKILIVNLSTGLVGEDNAAILGALMVTKIQLAAMSRADIDRADRRPFYLYVDEFQNFATDSFAVILSEARKYGLNLTVANQYVSQMPETVRDAVFGNVGSMASFRVGATDGTVLAKYFEPTFTPQDLITLNNMHCFISMSINGEKSTPFAGRTLLLPTPEADYSLPIIELTRTNYASSRVEVEDAISRWTLGGGEDQPRPASEVGGTENSLIATVDEQKPNFIASLRNPEMPPSGGNRDDQDDRPQRRDSSRGQGSGGDGLSKPKYTSTTYRPGSK
jgi:Helicase HerA, central domain